MRIRIAVAVALFAVVAACGKKDEPAEKPEPVAKQAPDPEPPPPVHAAVSGNCTSYKDYDSVAVCEQRCKDDDGTACWVLGTLYDSGAGLPESKEEAGKLFQKACDLESGDGCNELAVYYRNGKGGLPKDEAKMNETYARTRPMFQRECDAKRETSCFQLAGYYQRGWGGDADPAKAAELYARACELGSRGGCAQVEKLKAK